MVWVRQESVDVRLEVLVKPVRLAAVSGLVVLRNGRLCQEEGGREIFMGKLGWLFALRRAAAPLALLVARPACAARTLPMSAPHSGHFNLLI